MNFSRKNCWNTDAQVNKSNTRHPDGLNTWQSDYTVTQTFSETQTGTSTEQPGVQHD